MSTHFIFMVRFALFLNVTNFIVTNYLKIMKINSKMKNKIILYNLFLLLIQLHFITFINSKIEKLTILTQPIGDNTEGYTGHYGVTRSLIEGLKSTDIIFNYNPKKFKDVYDTVWVLSNIEALQQAIYLRKKEKIKKLIAGPNLMVRSNEYNKILVSPEIDLCIVPSEWVKQAYIEDEPSLTNRIKSWYAGVDTNFWSKSKDQKKNTDKQKVLVYWKTENHNFCQSIENLLKKNNWNPICIRYGCYGKNEYKILLSNVKFAIFISRSESQGLALAECWSMNIPTFVWDPNEPLIINGKMHAQVSAAPYLNKDVGMSWKTLAEFELILNNIKNILPQFNPRTWVLENMSDQICAQLFLKKIDEFNN